MSVEGRVLRRPATRRWLTVGSAAVVWVLLYALNGRFWAWLLVDVAGLDPSGRFGSGVLFFATDTVKITLLLVGVIFVVTILRSFMSVERTRAMLGGRRQGVGNVMAAGLGVITPFCSCSAVPAFIGFVAAGVPLGVTLSFLIASPLVNEVAIALLFGLFGLGPTLLYIGAGLAVAIVSGLVLGRLRLERWVEPFVFETRLRGQLIDSTVALGWDDRLQIASRRSGRSFAGSGPTCSSASAWVRRSTAGHPRTCSPATRAQTTRSPSRSRCCSGSPCTPTPPECCPSSRRCTTRACRWARSWPS
jgi:uncharacterized membrane protein YraQ (UPF0718 family)